MNAVSAEEFFATIQSLSASMAWLFGWLLLLLLIGGAL